jgi:hypothetical protein
VSDSSRLNTVLWDRLLAEQRQNLVRTLGEIALRQVRHAPVIEVTPDDEPGARVDTPCHAAA